MDFIKHKKIYFIISALIIIPGLLSLAFKGLRLGIDFTGGTLLEVRGEQIKKATSAEVEKVVESQQVEVYSVQKTGNDSFIIRAKTIDQAKNNQVMQALTTAYQKVDELRFETVGPTIGAELARNAIIAIIVAATFIVLYIAFSFRQVPKPTSSWRFGITAIAALLHDVLFTVGLFSILGWTLHVEVDSLFVTALLTIIGFSVHDTIVVYDRIRENLIKGRGGSFVETVNLSLNETLRRSINTSLTVVIVLTALLLLGGETTRWFVFALLIGILSGTYSSIFNASQLLVLWHEKTAHKQ